MLELDMLLLPFAEGPLASLSEVDQEAFQQLLACTDPEIYHWLIGTSQPPNELMRIMELVKQYASSRSAN